MLIQNQHLHHCLSLVKPKHSRQFLTDPKFPRRLYVSEKVDYIRRSGFGFSTRSKDDGLESAREEKRSQIQRFVTKRSEHQQNFTKNVYTDEDANLRELIVRLIIGKRGYNVKRFISETGLNFDLTIQEGGHIVISGHDVEVVNKAVEKVQQEIQRIKNETIFPFNEVVFIDEDVDLRERIGRMIIGKGGSNVQRLVSETGLNFRLTLQKSSHIMVSGPNTEVVNKAVEKVQQEIKRIKNKVNFPINRKVFTGEHSALHEQIGRKIIGVGGSNIKRLASDTGLNFELTLQKGGHVVVSGHDVEVVNKAVETVQQEIQRIKNETIFPFNEVVFIDEDADLRERIGRIIIGKRGTGVERFISDTGLDFELTIQKGGPIVISGHDVEVVNKAVEKVQQEIQRIKTETIFPFNEVVFIDEDVDLRERIGRMIIGKGGSNIQRLRSKTGLNFDLTMQKSGHVVVSVPDAELMNKAVEKVQQEIQRIKNETIFPFHEFVFIDEDADIHEKIFSMVIGKGGSKVKQLVYETGLNFRLTRHKSGYIMVSGPNAEVVNKAVKKVQQEIQRIKNETIFPFNQVVFTDRDADRHQQIGRKIIGKRGSNVQRLVSETGLNFRLTMQKGSHIVVSGPNVKVVNEAVEKVQQEIQSLKNKINFPFHRKVFTDEDSYFHEQICGMIIGKGGSNVKRLVSETGLDFDLTVQKTGHIVVSGLNVKVVNEAIEKVEQEIQRIKDRINFPFHRKVFTDEDSYFHEQICGMIIGKGGSNIKRFISGTGLNFELTVQKDGHVVVSGPNTEVVNKAVEKVEQEIQKIKDEIFSLQ
ncbi:vigilin-like [Ylistrum balloti]|uniref:vigilin-like n=1 Tax=Ylistrum balloti TaxID=509963 RepID=UPI002905B9E5|nr:vigilin-like [Ylistrum balloti]